MSVNSGGGATSSNWTLVEAAGLGILTGPAGLTFQAELRAARTLNGVATERIIRIESVVHFSASSYVLRYGTIGIWRETATNLTSLRLFGGLSNKILAGTYMRAWAPPTPLPL